MNDVQVRRQIYLILIFVSAGLIFGRIMAVDSIPDRVIQEYRLARIPQTLKEKALELRERGFSEEEIKTSLQKTAQKLRADALRARPTLSANDRSRWLTIRALVEPECRLYRYLPADSDGKMKSLYQTGEILRNSLPGSPDSFEKKNFKSDKYIKELVPYAIDKGMETRGWETIDMVKHGRPREEYDPSDPFSGYLYSSKPPLLPTLMAFPYWILYKTTGLTLRDDPFFVTRLLLVVYNLIPLMVGWFLMCGLIERFGASDSPASGWGKIFAASVLCFATFLSSFAVTLNNHLPGVVAIIIAFYAAVRILVDRDTRNRWFFLAALFGSLAVACELPAVLIALSICVILFVKKPKKTLLISIPTGLVIASAFFGTNYIAHGTLRPAYSQKRDHIALAKEENGGKSDSFQVSSFDQDDWYIYRYFPSGVQRNQKNARISYWADRQGVDRGEESHLRYAFHALAGHHGLFSLTPVWLLSMAGLFVWLQGKPEKGELQCRIFAGAVLCISLFFFVFYLTRDQGDRNYGGMTCGLRWFFPLIPFWILAILPFLNRIGRFRLGRAAALVLLFISAVSVSYPLWNPWSHPWILNLLLGR